MYNLFLFDQIFLFRPTILDQTNYFWLLPKDQLFLVFLVGSHLTLRQWLSSSLAAIMPVRPACFPCWGLIVLPVKLSYP